MTHKQFLPQCELVTKAYVCDSCGQPAQFLVWYDGLMLCLGCREVLRGEETWGRKG